MPKANLTLPDGTKVAIEGRTEEVAKLLRTVSGAEGASDVTSPSRRTKVKGKTKATKAKRNQTSSPPRQSGPLAYIRDLKEEDFFKSKRTIGDIQKALEAKGYIYPVTSLSGPLLRLVRERELGRIKEEDVWKYVHR